MAGRPNKTILLVEDNPDDEELTLMSLREAGLVNPIHVVRDGAQAIAWMRGRAPHELPVAVLLDLGLPLVDGFGVLTALKGDPQTRTVPIVVLTSSSIEEDIAKSYALGGNSYVRKPVAYEEFAAAVKQLGLYWLLLNEASVRSEELPR